MNTLVVRTIHFGSFVVTSQVFYQTHLSYALVNLKPLLPGHVLVCPLRRVPRFHDLTHQEVHDLFQTVQRVSRMLERVFDASALNIAIQDGQDAGQSVPHVHAHIIPRKLDDLKEKGGKDAIYEMLESEEGDLGKYLREKDLRRQEFPADEHRKPRSEVEMKAEAEWFSEEMEKESGN